jgi:hypothetical protein
MAFRLPAAGTGGGTAGGVTQSDLDAHAADTTNVHGFTDTQQMVATDDSRLSDKRTAVPGSVTALEIAPSLKPSGSAVAADEALRALGTTASTAASGDHSHAGLTADQAANVPSVRTLGNGALQAAVGNHVHSAAAITNTPALNVASTNVQAAINEVGAKAYNPVVLLTWAATLTVDMANRVQAYFRVTLGGNTTVVFSNVLANLYSAWDIEFAQPASGGPYTVTFPQIRWDNDVFPGVATAASSITQYTIWSVGGTPYRAVQVLKNTVAV